MNPANSTRSRSIFIQNPIKFSQKFLCGMLIFKGSYAGIQKSPSSRMENPLLLLLLFFCFVYKQDSYLFIYLSMFETPLERAWLLLLVSLSIWIFVMSLFLQECRWFCSATSRAMLPSIYCLLLSNSARDTPPSISSRFCMPFWEQYSLLLLLPIFNVFIAFSSLKPHPFAGHRTLLPPPTVGPM